MIKRSVEIDLRQFLALAIGCFLSCPVSLALHSCNHTRDAVSHEGALLNNFNSSSEEQVVSYLNAQPVRFIENKGQLLLKNGLQVMFHAEAPGMRVLITEKGLTYLFVKAEEEGEEDREKRIRKPGRTNLDQERVKTEMAWINVTLQDATINPDKITKEGAGSSTFNYLYPHCMDGIYGVQQFEKITIREVYPQIDWVIYNSSKGGMKYDFVVHPGADPGKIKLVYEGENRLRLNKNGGIEMKTRLGTLSEAKPYCYVSSGRSEVASHYKITSLTKHTSLLEFNLSDYDHNLPLIIDPQLVWSTFFGGDGADGLSTIKPDASGNLYVSGYIGGTTDLPVLNLPGSYFQSSFSSGTDAFVLKFSNNGVLLWATYFGGSGLEQILSIDTDSADNVYLVGAAASSSFPIQNLPGAYNQPASVNNNADALILKFSNAGVLLWSTYFGGSGFDEARSIDIDSNGNIYIVGYSESGDFPSQILAGAYNQAFVANDGAGFIAKFSGTGALLWSTSYGGSNVEEISAIALDGNNNLWVAGQTASTDLPVVNSGNAYVQASFGGFYDAFFAKFNSTGALVWSTYYGGSIEEDSYSIAADALNNVYITGLTSSPDFSLQTLPGAFNQSTPDGPNDVFLIKFDTNCSRLWCTLLGGNDQEAFLCFNNSLVIDECNNLYLMFTTFSTNINTTAYQTNCNGFNDNTLLAPNSDFLLMFFLSTGELKWSTLIGGDGGEFRAVIAIDKNNNLFLSGEWTNAITSSTYPLLNPGGGAFFDASFNQGLDDGYLMKFEPVQASYASQSFDADSCGACTGKAEVNVSCGEGPYTYQWSNGVTESNVGSSSSTITNLCPGIYTVNVSFGCNNDTTITFEISGETPLNVVVTSENETCGFTNGRASAVVNGGFGTYSFNWSNGLTGSSISGLSAGNYTVLVTDQNGCTGTSQVSVGSSPASGITLTISDTILTLNESATIELSGGLLYNWTPSDGLSCTDCPIVIANPNASLSYTVTGIDSSGCPFLRTINLVREILCGELFVPDIFSPNGFGDLENETFCVYSNCIKNMELGIYNRWGELIFRTTEPKTCWDGTHQGVPAPVGVYAYRLFVDLEDGRRIEKTGSVTLTR